MGGVTYLQEPGEKKMMSVPNRALGLIIVMSGIVSEF
jgi:hypothetical protein